MSDVTAVVVAPDGSWLATGSLDGTVRIWDRDTWDTLATLAGHTREVTALAVAPDGSWLATGSFDETVRIWDTTAWEASATLTGHISEVTALSGGPRRQLACHRQSPHDGPNLGCSYLASADRLERSHWERGCSRGVVGWQLACHRRQRPDSADLGCRHWARPRPDASR